MNCCLYGEFMMSKPVRSWKRSATAVADGEGVHQPGVAPVGRQLDEADLLEMVIEAVRLGVEADRAAALEGAGELRQGLRGADPGGRHGREYTLWLNRSMLRAENDRTQGP